MDPITETAKEIIKGGMKEIVKPVYDDGLKPVTKEVGKSLETLAGVLNIVLMPAAVLVHGYREIEKNLKEALIKKLSNISNEQIAKPPLNIAGPILERYRYNHGNEELADMFISLLANSMDINLTEIAHPAFIDIINQLLSEEAKLFKVIAISPACPKVDIAIENIGDGSYTTLYRNFIHPELAKSVKDYKFIRTYIDNLERLSLISCTSGGIQESYQDEELYNPLIEDSYVKRVEKTVNLETQKLKITKGIIHITDFGRTFYRAVTR